MKFPKKHSLLALFLTFVILCLCAGCASESSGGGLVPIPSGTLGENNSTAPPTLEKAPPFLTGKIHESLEYKGLEFKLDDVFFLGESNSKTGNGMYALMLTITNSTDEDYTFNVLSDIEIWHEDDTILHSIKTFYDNGAAIFSAREFTGSNILLFSDNRPAPANGSLTGLAPTTLPSNFRDGGTLKVYLYPHIEDGNNDYISVSFSQSDVTDKVSVADTPVGS
jgi:hypothetical protein